LALHFGFIQIPDIPAALRRAKDRGCIDAESAPGEWTLGADAPSEPKQSYFA